jgi:hypothetical protein
VAVVLASSAVLGAALLPLPALVLVGATGGSSVPLMAMVIVAGVATAAGAALLRERETVERPGRGAPGNVPPAGFEPALPPPENR